MAMTNREGNADVDDAVGGGVDAMKRKYLRPTKMTPPHQKNRMTTTAGPVKATTRSKPTAIATNRNPAVAGGADDGAEDGVAVAVKTMRKQQAAKHQKKMPTAMPNPLNLPY